MEVFKWEGNAFVPIEHLAGLNRAFLYADGFFETLLIKDGLPSFWNAHKDRIKRTAAYLLMDPIDFPNLEIALRRLIKNDQMEYARLRLTFFRAGLGRYTPKANNTEVVAQLEPMSTLRFNRMPAKSWAFGDELHEVCQHDRFKLIGKHRQVLYALQAEGKRVEELVVLNTSNEVVEGVSGNIYIYDKGKVFTPPLSSGCLDGIIRGELLRNELVEERSLSKTEFEASPLSFTTNSIEGIRLLQHKMQPMAERVLDELRAKLDRLAISSIRDFQETQPL